MGTTMTCIRGHEIRGPADRVANGSCRQCHRDDLRAIGARKTEAYRLLRDIEYRAQLLRNTI